MLYTNISIILYSYNPHNVYIKVSFQIKWIVVYSTCELNISCSYAWVPQQYQRSRQYYDHGGAQKVYMTSDRENNRKEQCLAIILTLKGWGGGGGGIPPPPPRRFAR